jgi:hypothetical protein
MKLSIDLLTPIACTNNERIHTRALTYLLSSASEHDFGNKVLIELLNKIRNSKNARSRAAKVLRLLSSKQTTTSVIPEYRHIEQKTHRLGWCDIRIEIAGKALIVIENKIDAPEGRDSEGKGQLEWYEKHAKKWEKTHQSSKPIKPILIFLTRKTERRKNWTCLSYIDLASALRHVWQKNKQAKARVWLGLYIATIMRGVLKIDPRRAEAADLLTYLGDHP